MADVTPDDAFERGLDMDVMRTYAWFHTPLEFVNGKHTTLYLSGRYGRLDVFEAQLAMGADLMQQMPGSRSTVLHAAAFYGQPLIAQAIVNSPLGIKCVNILNKWNESPLNNAFQMGNKIDIRLVTLLTVGLSVDNFRRLVQNTPGKEAVFKKKFEPEGNTFLHFSSMAMNYEISELLAEGRDGCLLANCANSNNEMPLSILLRNKDLGRTATNIHSTLLKIMSTDAVRNSLKHAVASSSFNINDCVSNVEGNRKQLLQLASEAGKTEIVRMLVEEFGAEVNSTDLDDFSTPLIRASEGHHYDTMRYLCDKGADANMANNKGATAFIYMTDVLSDSNFDERLDCFLRGIKLSQGDVNKLIGESTTDSQLSVIINRLIDSGNEPASRFIYKVLENRGVDLRPFVDRALCCGHVGPLAAVLDTVEDSTMFIDVLASRGIKSASHPFGDTLLYLAVMEANRYLLAPFMQYCCDLVNLDGDCM